MKEVSENEKSVAVVIGAAGQLGGAIVTSFAQTHDVVALRRAGLDVTDHAAVMRRVVAARPAVIVNCTAYNDVDGAEDNAATALAVNGFAVRSLARAAEAAEAILVHYSTDFVFDGAASAPYTEESATGPRGVYAASKLLGEWFALDADRAYVLRVESLFGSRHGWQGRRGTLDAIVDGIEQGREVRVFTDRVVSPSYTPDIAAATRHLVDSGSPHGLYHCVNAGYATWHDVAARVAQLLGTTPRLVPITMAEVQLKAPRPRFCALSPEKLARAGFAMPPLATALERWLTARKAPAA